MQGPLGGGVLELSPLQNYIICYRKYILITNTNLGLEVGLLRENSSDISSESKLSSCNK